MTIGAHAVYPGDVIDALGARLDALPQYIRQSQRVPLGVYRGLRFGLVLDPQFAPEVYLEGAITRRSPLSREHHGPRAVLNALERLAGGYGSECNRVRQDLALAESQLRDYKARLGAPFPHDAYLTELTTLRDQLKAGLSGAAAEQGADASPTVAELAERIKTHKAAHTIEATPQRTGKRRSQAEEPVTARIRRRAEEIPATEPHLAQSPSGDGLPSSGRPTSPASPAADAGASRDGAVKSETINQERAGRGR